jgi:hypothetical protein
MAIRAGKPVTAGLDQVAQMDRRERARVVSQLCEQYPAFRSLLTQVSMARGVAFASGLALAVAVIMLVHGASVWGVSALVFVGLAGFGYVAVVLTDSRFDLLLAVLGAHRTDELHGRLVTDQIYGADPATSESDDDAAQRPAIIASHAVGPRIVGLTDEPGIPGHAS